MAESVAYKMLTPPSRCRSLVPDQLDAWDLSRLAKKDTELPADSVGLGRRHPLFNAFGPLRRIAIAMSFTIMSAACSRVTTDACVPLSTAYVSAAEAYQMRDFSRASREFEAESRRMLRCPAIVPADLSADGVRQEFAVYELLTAAQSAHWAGDDARGRRLASQAKVLSHHVGRMLKNDVDDNEGMLLADREQADNDLTGEWTIGLRQ